MARLSQIIAIKKDAQSKAERVTANIYHQLQKPEPLAGISKTYTPRDENGETLPSQGNRVQYTVEEGLKEVTAATSRYLDILAAQEATDQIAKADIKIDGEDFLTDVPVTLLLALERQLAEEMVQVRKLPTLSLEFEWHYDADQGLHVTTPVRTVRSKKVPRNHVKAQATDKHAEQVEVFFEDVVVGDYTTRNFSGAIPMSRKKEIMSRLEKLTEAVKQAREEANTATAVDLPVGEKIFGYLYGSAGTE